MPKENQVSLLELTEKFRTEYRQAWGKMPYGASLRIDYGISHGAIIGNLDRLRKRLEELAEENKTRDVELDKLRRLVRAVGEFNRLANEAAAPDKTQTGPG